MRYRVEKAEVIFKEFFTIERAAVSWEQFDGRMGPIQTRYTVRRGRSVGIIPVFTPADRIALVKQFRYPTAGDGFDGFLWEIPAGMVHGTESPEETARRELEEEIGLRTQDLTPLMSFYLSPGALDEMFHLFLARVPPDFRVRPVGGNRAEEENLLIRVFSKAELLSMIREQQIVDAKTITALLYYFCSDNLHR